MFSDSMTNGQDGHRKSEEPWHHRRLLSENLASGKRINTHIVPDVREKGTLLAIRMVSLFLFGTSPGIRTLPLAQIPHSTQNVSGRFL
jgi:hypothetical protein